MPTVSVFSGLFTETKKLANLAWPLLIAQVTQTLMGVSDTIMAGRYQSLDMAAVAIGFSVSLPMLVFLQGVSLALSPIIARFDGAKKTTEISFVVQQMLYLALFVSAVMLLVLTALPFAVGLIDMDEQMFAITMGYLKYVFLAAPAIAIYQTLRNYCEGLSLTRPTMLIMVIGLLVNIPVNYIFINGLWGMPEMGGVGCGLATMLVYYIMAIATFGYTLLAKRLKPVQLYTKYYRPNLSQILSLLGLGLPIAFTLLFEVTLFAAVAVLLAPFGPLTVASHQIALNVSALIFMLPLSIGIALAIRIGFLIGERKFDQTKVAYRSAMLLAVSTVFVTATVTILFNQQIASIYSYEKPVIAAAASLLLLASLFQMSDAIQVVSANALRGYKDTRAMFLLSFFSYWLIGFPVGIVLGLTDLVVPKMAASGFWIGFITGLSAAAVVMYWRVKLIQGRIISTMHGATA